MLLENIKKLCRQMGITLYSLEKDLGLGKGTISRWKTASPSVDKLIQVAEYFNVTLDYLVSRSADKVSQGNVTLCIDGDAVCGSRFETMDKLLDLVKLFATGENVEVVISKAGTRADGDGASSSK